MKEKTEVTDEEIREHIERRGLVPKGGKSCWFYFVLVI